MMRPDRSNVARFPRQPHPCTEEDVHVQTEARRKKAIASREPKDTRPDMSCMPIQLSAKIAANHSQ